MDTVKLSNAFSAIDKIITRLTRWYWLWELGEKYYNLQLDVVTVYEDEIASLGARVENQSGMIVSLNREILELHQDRQALLHSRDEYVHIAENAMESIKVLNLQVEQLRTTALINSGVSNESELKADAGKNKKRTADKKSSKK